MENSTGNIGSPLGWVAVNTLSARYGIVRSGVYQRLSKLEIERRKVGIKSYITAEQLELLDALHEFIQEGGTTAEFLFHRDTD